ncbi:MAG TPA: ChbG/HpnK family deacetylase [Candidatus Tectomicrobia bacterium]|nr:ChbG/HpnK family deacetylase [Candidatus Tectomicrobia bacterium]
MQAQDTDGAGLSSTGGGRYLIVNADDFGQSHCINRGIVIAHRRGIVTSASLMVRWPAAPEAAAYAREHPTLSLGLHVDLGEKVFHNGEWEPVYTVVPLPDPTAIADEVWRQLDAFRHLMGRDPSHIDSHQHVHLREPVRTVLIEMAQQLEMPLRHCSRDVCYRGGFYGQTAEGVPLPEVISVAGLIRILETLPSGYTELGCHPGDGCDLNTMYRQERVEELGVLCDPRVRAAIQTMGIELRSFENLLRGRDPSLDDRSA